MRARLLAGLAVLPLLAGCGSGGSTLVIATPLAPAASSAPADSVAPAADVEVYVTGAVARPGVYRLAADSRVQDAVTAAGGFVDGADMVRVNLAERVRDEEEIFVPQVGQAAPSDVPGQGLNVNTASATQLRQALGLTSTVASKIVAYRKAHGPFTTLDDLRKVPVPDADLQRIRNLVSFH